MKFPFKNKRGETLIEVIVAVGVLAIGAITATSLMISTLRGTSVSKNYLVAVNLAREGIEAVRSIRDTNWLRFAYDTNNCWDVKSDEEVVAANGNCIAATKFNTIVAPEYYRVNMTPQSTAQSPEKAPFKFFLEAATSKFIPLIDGGARKFYLIEPDVNNSNIYRHTDNIGEYASSGTSFYRAIIFENISDTAAPGTPAEKLKVVSAVQWLEQGEMKEMLTETVLKNYQ